MCKYLGDKLKGKRIRGKSLMRDLRRLSAHGDDLFYFDAVHIQVTNKSEVTIRDIIWEEDENGESVFELVVSEPRMKLAIISQVGIDESLIGVPEEDEARFRANQELHVVQSLGQKAPYPHAIYKGQQYAAYKHDPTSAEKHSFKVTPTAPLPDGSFVTGLRLPFLPDDIWFARRSPFRP